MRGLVRYLNRMRLGQQAVYFEYPYSFDRRWGTAGNPRLAAILEAAEPTCRARLAELADFGPHIRAMSEAGAVKFDNRFMPVLDGLSVMWAARRAGKTYMEIGSGYSTIFARHAIGEKGASAKIVSIDPEPRKEIDSICDEVIRSPLESLDLALFDRLESGDTLFVDGSHRAFTNSDVTVMMLDILPRLKPGVLIGVHDIFLPFDYPEVWRERTYNEQYLLGCYLLANPGYFSLQLCNHWAWSKRLHHEPLQDIWNILGPETRDRGPSAFWAVKN